MVIPSRAYRQEGCVPVSASGHFSDITTRQRNVLSLNNGHRQPDLSGPIRCQKQSFELWLSSIIGVTAYSQKHAPTINPRMKLISLSKSNLCPRPHPCRIPHNAVIFAGGPLDLVERPRNTFATTCPSPDPVAIHSRPSWSLRSTRVRKGEPPACAMDTKQ